MWRVEDHTADVLLHVEAEGWAALLKEAALAFAGFVCAAEVPQSRLRAMRMLEVHGADTAETWVQWWRALHRLWTVEGLLPISAGVHEDSTPGDVRAVVRCLPASEVPAEADVKAVTWHGAEAREGDEGGWIGRIVLDV